MTINPSYRLTQNVLLQESGFKLIHNSQGDLEGIAKLRHDVYSIENGWAPSNPDGLEIDSYDAVSSHVSVEAPCGKTIATLRTATYEHEWMMHSCFTPTLKGVKDPMSLKDPLSNEASRLAVSKDYRNKYIGNMRVLEWLLAGIYYLNTQVQFCQYSYFTVEPITSALLKRSGLVHEQVGIIATMPDGCKIATYKADMRKLSGSRFVKLLDDNKLLSKT